MIDFIRGQMVYADSDYVAVDVNGVGYQVFVTNPYRWEEGENVCLYTHYIVREDAHLLYGFPTKEERDLFRLLLEVSGIGPKAGVAMLAGGEPQQLVTAIQMEDLKFLTRLPGIGKKTAQRIVLDLKDKLKKLGWESRLQSSVNQADAEVSVHKSDSDGRDVIDALLSLGYNEEEAEWAVREALASSGAETLSTEDWIKRALQISMKR
ncbi:Holliday junction branch migration protein RuvA [Paenactinomyces guangxiensis]|uniref:Holliday junction branch migration complex subunit RuvA n=1 Tax=Paenactinomyces guangxiensis TaxID=1490290 RepID=A0A7W1WTF1_9BACL|nr:Holliday junction branch migration protein RuvA [Paenactinomyces guangxiensis]MBA4495756.1 Holliday junction branch migration protein RuvA [Paenactinomyces guangxiensis]MBH8592745.1 Holliday junction branch migration protein RuvA [Paenactinomyces guangxiensis]